MAALTPALKESDPRKQRLDGGRIAQVEEVAAS